MRAIETRLWAAGMGCLLALGLAGCRHGRDCCGSQAEGGSMACGSTPMPASSPYAASQPAAAPAYGGQKTCPVSGGVLGAKGPAVPVTVRGQTIYVCCSGCVARVQSDPDTYLARVAAERAGVPNSLPAAAAAAPAAAPAPLYGGQKTCPVTGEELDREGGAIPVTVKGQTIYVCCPGCAAKVKRNPDAYLAKVAAERATAAARP